MIMRSAKEHLDLTFKWENETSYSICFTIKVWAFIFFFPHVVFHLRF